MECFEPTITLEVSTPEGTSGTVALPETGPLPVDGAALPASTMSGLLGFGGGNHADIHSSAVGVEFKFKFKFIL